tara:strand:- start:456 stop:632 length:177 start_codon:yes stop_codon:yes gene_type:complete
MTRDDVIDEIYRSIRDALNNLQLVGREKNKVTFYKDEKKITVSFRIKIEDTDINKLEY